MPWCSVSQLREPCRCENTGQEIGPGSIRTLPREINTEALRTAWPAAVLLELEWLLWNLFLMPKTVFMIYHDWFSTFIGSALSSLVTLSSSWEAVYFHLLHIHWCLYYLDNSFIRAYAANTIDWMGSHFCNIFDFLRPVSPLVLVIVQFLLAMNFARPQLLLLYFAFQVLSCIL